MIIMLSISRGKILPLMSTPIKLRWISHLLETKSIGAYICFVHFYFEGPKEYINEVLKGNSYKLRCGTCDSAQNYSPS